MIKKFLPAYLHYCKHVWRNPLCYVLTLPTLAGGAPLKTGLIYFTGLMLFLPIMAMVQIDMESRLAPKDPLKK